MIWQASMILRRMGKKNDLMFSEFVSQQRTSKRVYGIELTRERVSMDEFVWGKMNDSSFSSDSSSSFSFRFLFSLLPLVLLSCLTYGREYWVHRVPNPTEESKSAAGHSTRPDTSQSSWEYQLPKREGVSWVNRENSYCDQTNLLRTYANELEEDDRSDHVDTMETHISDEWWRNDDATTFATPPPPAGHVPLSKPATSRTTSSGREELNGSRSLPLCTRVSCEHPKE